MSKTAVVEEDVAGLMAKGEEVMSYAKISLLFDHPYLSAALWGCRIVPMDEIPNTDFAAIDQNWRLYFVPKNWGKLSIAEGTTILYHELMHALRNHCDRALLQIPKLGRNEEATSLNVDDQKTLMAWAWACFLPGTLLSDGKAIEDEHKNLFGQSGNISFTRMKREYNGPICKIIIDGKKTGTEIKVTPEHPFKIARRKHKYGLSPVKLLPTEWLPIGKTKKGDFLIIPNLPSDNDLISLSLEPFVTKPTYPDKLGRKYTIPNGHKRLDFPVAEDTAWLLGLYTAEGSGKEKVELSLGSHEIYLVERVKKIIEPLGFVVNADINSKRPTNLRISFGGPILARAFKDWCGDGAKNKHIPNFILFHKNLKLIRAYLEGLVTGDGNKLKNRSYVSLGTSSQALKIQTRLAVAKLGMGSSVTVQIQKEGRKIHGRSLPAGLLYHIRWYWEKKSSTRKMNGHSVAGWNIRWHSVPEGIAIPITEITTEYYNGPVYNFSTSDHTYIVEGILVHNCDCEINDDLMSEKMTFPTILNPKTKEHEPYAVYPKKFNLPDGELAETYLKKLKKKIKVVTVPTVGFGNKGSCGSASDGQPKSYEKEGKEGETDSKGNQIPKGLSSSEKEILRRMVAEEIKSRTDTPGHWDRWAESILHPKVNWMAAFMSCLRSNVNMVLGKSDYTYRRLSRRDENSPFIFPSLEGPQPQVVVIQDTSGSMNSESDLPACLAEVKGILKATGCDVTVMSVDAKVHNKQRVRSIKSVKLKGGGGTDMGVGIAAAQELKPDFIVVLTDGETPWPKHGPKHGTKLLIGLTAKPRFANPPTYGKVFHLWDK